MSRRATTEAEQQEVRALRAIAERVWPFGEWADPTYPELDNARGHVELAGRDPVFGGLHGVLTNEYHGEIEVLS